MTCSVSNSCNRSLALFSSPNSLYYFHLPLLSNHLATFSCDSRPSTSSSQVPWFMIGSIMAASVIVIVLIASLVFTTTVCCLKGRSKKEEQKRQSVINDEELYYDYVQTFGGPTPRIRCNYSAMGGDCNSTESVDRLRRKETYTMSNRRCMSIETSQNIAYHSYSALDVL